MRQPDEIIDAVAARLGYVTPVQPHMALNAAFVTACLQERDREWTETRAKEQRKPEGAQAR